MTKSFIYNVKSEKLVFVKPGKVETIPVKLPHKISKGCTGRLATAQKVLPLIIVNNAINADKDDIEESLINVIVQNPSKQDIFIGKGDIFCTMTITNNSI